MRNLAFLSVFVLISVSGFTQNSETVLYNSSNSYRIGGKIVEIVLPNTCKTMGCKTFAFNVLAINDDLYVTNIEYIESIKQYLPINYLISEGVQTRLSKLNGYFVFDYSQAKNTLLLGKAGKYIGSNNMKSVTEYDLKKNELGVERSYNKVIISASYSTSDSISVTYY